MNLIPFCNTTALAVLVAVATFGAQSSKAELITDFNGLEVEISVETTADGGQGFYADLIGPDTAIIGSGNEFSINVGAAGFSPTAIRIDFDGLGLVNAYADSQFGIGNTSFSDFSFDILFRLPGVEVTSAISSGDLVRGDASASGLDPVIWSFVNETDNAFGKLMTFGSSSGPTPKVQLSASSVPEPFMPLVGLGLLTVAALRCRRG